MHQIDISILSPFKEIRWGNERRAIKLIKEWFKDNPNIRDIKPQMFLQISKCLKNEENKFDFNYFEKEISNRYSYYYSRVEAGVFSPIFGALIFLIIDGIFYFILGYSPVIDINSVDKWRFLYIIYILTFIIAVSVLIWRYCKNLLEEIDDLEYSFIKKYKKIILQELKESPVECDV